ncbi:MAG: tetratricopeptide repeat protein [Rhizobacter sp.]|nr:tetratricopeptide repeat protein [Chlorobiales bacterium]
MGRCVFALLFTAILLSLAPAAAQSQSGDFEIAESFFQAGNYEKAAVLFEKLHQQETNALVFDRLRVSLFQLRQFDKLIVLLERESSQRPKDAVLKIQLAQTYYAKEDISRGDNLLERLCAEQGTIPVFNAIVTALDQAKQYERIEKFVRLARQRFDNPFLFARLQANAYLYQSKYAEATREFLKLLAQEFPDFGTVQSSILSYATKSEPDILQQTVSAIAGAKETYNGNARLLISQLLSSLYIEQGDYAGAFKEIESLDARTQSQGGQLLYFAQMMLSQKQFKVAASAFKQVMSQSPNRFNVQRASLGYARTLDQESRSLMKAAAGKEERTVKASLAIAAYTDYEKNYGSAPELAQALLATAELHSKILGNTPAARTAVEKLRQKFPASAESQAAQLIEAGFLIEQENLAAATAMIETLLQSKRLTPALRAEATLLKGRLELYQSRFIDAVKTLSAIELTSDAGNDAIELRLLLTEALSDTVKNPSALPAFTVFTRAMKQEAAKQPTKAAEDFGKVAQEFPASPFADDALSRKAMLEETLSPAEAMKTYEQLVSLYPKSFHADRSLFRLGELSETLTKDKPKAMNYYERLLAEYPKSLSAAEARRRLRLLREPS